MENDASPINPRILVACQAAEQAGLYYTRWLDAALPVDELRNAIEAFLVVSPCDSSSDNWVIVDSLGFEGICTEDLRDLQDVSALALAIVELGKVVVELRKYFDSVAETVEILCEKYDGAYQSIEEWAEEIFIDDEEIPERVLPYIDYEAFAKVQESSGQIISIRFDELVHIFRRY